MGDRLRQFSELGFGSVSGLARALGVIPSALHHYLGGNRKPGAAVLDKLYQLGCDPTWLLTGDGEMCANNAAGEMLRSRLEHTNTPIDSVVSNTNDTSKQPPRKKLPHSFKKTDFARRITQLREELGLSQNQFAKKIGTSSGHISDIERGQTIPGAAFLFDLHRATGVNLEWLLAGVVPIAKPNEPEIIYPALRELLSNTECKATYNISLDESRVLKAIRFPQTDVEPDRQFFLDVLLDLRRRMLREAE